MPSTWGEIVEAVEAQGVTRDMLVDGISFDPNSDELLDVEFLDPESDGTEVVYISGLSMGGGD